MSENDEICVSRRSWEGFIFEWGKKENIIVRRAFWKPLKNLLFNILLFRFFFFFLVHDWMYYLPAVRVMLVSHTSFLINVFVFFPQSTVWAFKARITFYTLYILFLFLFFAHSISHTEPSKFLILWVKICKWIQDYNGLYWRALKEIFCVYLPSYLKEILCL